MLETGIFAWEPKSIGNSTPVVVAMSVIAAIIIISLIGFGVWRLQSGRRERNGYNMTPIKPESIWNSTPLVVAMSVIAAIIIISLIGFGVWRLQSGRRERNGYNMAPISKYQQCIWIQIQILCV
ncbi:hypothetical protein WISP_80113 [Willisornis vidua]|uniref:Uncharacterized protein n=1 Tax=Willisornis vidua TaxID=1566151 RepID=A0ABQ9D4W4_9PASS|nr:hypothetical protein WISP_80113 [Willisornis vidua]